jgi:hypothetical protein
MAEDFIGEIIHDFAPKPGGIIDQHHRHKAAREAADAQEQHVNEGIQEPAYRAVKVAPESPESLSTITFTLAPGAHTQILPLSPYRYRASIIVTDPGSVQDSRSNTGTVAAPGAGATITQLSLPPGTYSVAWTVELAGTLAVGDTNNFSLFQSGTGSNAVIINSVNPPVAGSYPQATVIVNSTNADNFIKILTIGAGTAGSSYTGTLTVTPLGSNVGPVLLCKDESAVLGNVGFPLPANQIFPVFSRAQLHAVNQGPQTVQVAVFAETYAPVKPGFR